MRTIDLPPDAAFIDACAREILSFAGGEGASTDLSQHILLLPNLKLAPALAAALLRANGGRLLLPRMDTLAGLVTPWVAELDPLPDSARQLMLHALLAARRWLDEATLWAVADELVALFDTLTQHSVRLPDDEDELLARLEEAFELRNLRPLNFEAKLVNTLWRAEAAGRPSREAARLIAAARWAEQLTQPLIVLQESRRNQALDALLERLRGREAVLRLRPDRALTQTALGTFLGAVLPLDDGATKALPERIDGVSALDVQATAARLSLQSHESLEDLGAVVALQVRSWIAQGKREIAIIASDRLAARRACALLERDEILVQDETGWKMVTTRVAAVVESWLDVVVTDGWHRSLIDLLRSTFLFEGMSLVDKAQASETIERRIRRENLLSGLVAIRAVVQDAPQAADMIERLIEARRALTSSQPLTICDWLQRLERSLEALEIPQTFAREPDGRQWLEWLKLRKAELASETGRYSFQGWKTWLAMQMESELCRDESIESPVILTHLAATRLRAFEAAVIIGADTEHFALEALPGWLTHAGVRSELGLPSSDEIRRQRTEDLCGLILSSGECAIHWQSARRDEQLMAAPEVALLQAAYELAGVKSRRIMLPETQASLCRLDDDPAPRLPSDRIPAAISASALQTMIDCPYRYFTRHVLLLGEAEDPAEALEKSEFGGLVHEILRRFHEEHPVLLEQDEALLVTRLTAISAGVFESAVARNFQDHAWRLRWSKLLSSYVSWQRKRELDGWRFSAGEQKAECILELKDGGSLRLFGRLDRIDRGADDRVAVLDYKMRSLTSLKTQAGDPDDVQLAFYGLLMARTVSEAAYVSLDGREVAVASLEEPDDASVSLQDCVTRIFVGLRAGAQLKAQGVASTCTWCEMRGLCRKQG